MEAKKRPEPSDLGRRIMAFGFSVHLAVCSKAAQNALMNRFNPSGYEKKFADFIQMCADLKAKGLTQVVIAHPSALGDNYEEMIESLSRLADAGLALNIAQREHRPGRN